MINKFSLIVKFVKKLLVKTNKKFLIANNSIINTKTFTNEKINFKYRCIGSCHCIYLL